MTAETSKASLDTRTRILEAAIELLMRGKGADVSMAEIARAAGVSRQAVYLHFADRGSLFIELVHYADEKRGLAAELDKVRNAPSGVAALRTMAAVQARTNPGIWPLARATDAIRRTDEEVERAWQDRLKDRYAGCAAVVKRLIHEGSLRRGLTAEIATDLLWSITSLRAWEDLVIQRRWKPQQYEERIGDLLEHTLTNKP